MDAIARLPDALRLAPDLSVGDGLEEMLAGALGALERGEAAGPVPSAEAIHHFRIGMRRLRSVLSAFADVLPKQERHALGDRLRAMAQRYGRAREWDVFLAEITAPLTRAMPEAAVLDGLVAEAIEARRQALPPGDTLAAAIADIGEAVEKAAWLRRPPAALAAYWERPLRDYAAAVLDERHRRLRRQAKQVDIADQAAFHGLRIRIKKLRYPAELLKSLFDERKTGAYLDRLIGLQHVLGRLNDALIGETLAATLDGPLEARHLVRGWIARETEIARERFPATAGAFRHAKSFWEC